MGVYRVHLRRTTVIDEFYVIVADDEVEAEEVAADPEMFSEIADTISDDYELQAVEQIE